MDHFSNNLAISQTPSLFQNCTRISLDATDIMMETLATQQSYRIYLGLCLGLLANKNSLEASQQALSSSSPALHLSQDLHLAAQLIDDRPEQNQQMDFASITFLLHLHKDTPRDVVLKATGSLKELGNWSPDHGILFQEINNIHHKYQSDHADQLHNHQSQDHNELKDFRAFIASVKVPFQYVDSFEYKFVAFRRMQYQPGLVKDDPSYSSLSWELSENRHIDVHQLAGLSGKGFVVHPNVCFGWRPGNITFQIHYNLKEHEIMAITGDPREIGGWNSPGPIPMTLSKNDLPLPKGLDGVGKYWQITVPKPPMSRFDYRYIIIDTRNNTQRWEREPNRTCRVTDDLQMLQDDVNFVSNMEFDLIPPNILLGPYPQCIEDLDRLKQVGVTAVVNVQTDGDIATRKMDWEGMQDHYKKIDIKLCRVPIHDFNPIDLEKNLLLAINTLHQLLSDTSAEKNNKVYVHCTAGMSRAAATVIGCLAIYDREKYPTAQAAHDYVKSHRKVIAPNMGVVSHVINRAKLELYGPEPILGEAKVKSTVQDKEEDKKMKIENKELKSSDMDDDKTGKSVTIVSGDQDETKPSGEKVTSLHHVTTPEEFDDLLKETQRQNKVLVVDFNSKYCRKCVFLMPKFKRLAEELTPEGKAVFASLDVNKVAKIPQREGIKQMPTFSIYRNCEKVFTMEGVAGSTLQEILAEEIKKVCS